MNTTKTSSYMRGALASIGSRLLAAFVTVLLLFCVVLAVTASKVESVRDLTEQNLVEAQKLNLANEWLAHIRQNSARSLAVAFAPGSEMLDFFRGAMTATSRDTTETQRAFLELSATDEAALRRAELVGDIRTQWLAVRDEINAVKASGDDARARQLVESRFQPVTDRYVEVTQALVDGQMADMAALQARINAEFRSLYVYAGALFLAALAVSIVLTWRITTSVTQPVKEAVSLADAVAQGDLTQTVVIKRDDELGQLLQALRTMQNNLVKVVSEVRVASDSVATGSEEIATGTLDLSQRTEEQASNLEETAASMEELTVTIKQNAATARQASQLAQGASEAAIRGGEVVGQVVTTMQDITQSSNKIADIISVIDGIAFQTNILALNAAVEAARAGEQGRGFAVVASEVRNLAQRSAAAAKEIKELINTSVERVEIGSRQVAEAGESVSDIVNQVKRVTDLISEITAASHEQASGIAQVGDAVNQLDQVTQQNAALVEESSAAAESLKHQAARLIEVVSVFNLGQQSQPRHIETNVAAVGDRANLKAAGSTLKKQESSVRRTPALHTPRVAPLASAGLQTQLNPTPPNRKEPTLGANDDWTSF